jgi:glyoxylase-like metal-dependent hydrolase (beta-lactamase superfamily II)
MQRNFMPALILKQLAPATYYLPSLTNVGIYVKNSEAILIDSGNDKEAGRQIGRIIEQNNWQLKLIINTHSNADHIGGNAFLQNKTDCRIAATRLEAAFITEPLLETSFLYGGYPAGIWQNKFLLAKPSTVTDISPVTGRILDTDLEAIPLPGHFVGMIGVKTPDNVLFLGDCIFSEYVINKYHLFYIFDVGMHLNTLNTLKEIPAEWYIPSHGQPLNPVEMAEVITLNENQIHSIAAVILSCCEQAVTTETVLADVCEHYGIELDANQYILISSTIKSYLSYLYNLEKLEALFNKGQMLWQAK